MEISTRTQKVLFVITKSNWGGAQKYVYDLATELQARGYDVTVAAGGEGEMIHRLREHNVRVVSIPGAVRDVSLFKDIKLFFWLVSFFRKERPDVVHLNSSKIGGLGAVTARIARVPHIIFTGHGWAFNEDRPWIQQKIIHVIHFVTIALCHTTICVSEKTKLQLQAPTFLAKKCIVVHNGIRNILFKPATAFYEDYRTMRRERIALVSIGELHPSKGFDLALTYLAHLTDISWEWFILGEGHYRQQIESLIKKHDLSSRVHLIGHTKDAAQYLESFDLFFLPSRTEALAYVAIEALQTDLPIIASDVGGIPEVLGNDPGSTLIDIRNEKTITVLREKLLTHPSKITSGRDELRKEFSLERMVEKTIRVYNL